MTKEEFNADLKRRLKGLPSEPERSVNYVANPPEGFNKWVIDHADRIASAKSLPYYIRQNQPFVKAALAPKELTALEVAAKRHAARTPEEAAAIQKAWDDRRKRYRRIELAANNVLKVAKDYGEVDYSELQGYIESGDLKRMRLATRSTASEVLAMKRREEAISDLIPDAHKWHKLFTMAELESSHASIRKTLGRWGWNINSMISLTDMRKALSYEISWMETKGKKYATWQIARDAYKNRLALVEHRIDMLLIKHDILDNINFIKVSKSDAGKIIVSEFDHLFTNDTTSIHLLKTKANEVKRKAQQLEMQRRAREEKKRRKSPLFIPKSDDETKKDFIAYMRSIGKTIFESEVVVDDGFIHLQHNQHKYIYEGSNIETDSEHKQLWNHRGASRWGAAGYIQTGNSWKINKDFRDTGVVGDINSAAEAKLRANGATNDDIKTIKLLDKKCEQFSLPVPIIVTRYVKSSALDAIFGRSFRDYSIRNLLKEITPIKGVELAQDPAYMSASTNELQNVFYSQYDVKLMIEIPPRSTMYFSNNYPESEIVLRRGSRLQFLNASTGYTGGCLHLIIRCRLIP